MSTRVARRDHELISSHRLVSAAELRKKKTKVMSSSPPDKGLLPDSDGPLIAMSALAAGDKEVETARLKAVMAPVEERILQLIDAAAPATRIFGRNLSKAYEKEFGKPLDPEQLTGQTDLRQMLGRRNLLPRTGVKGGGDQWYVYRLLQDDAAALDKVQERILQLIGEAKKPELIDGHGLQTLYGDKYKQKLEFGAFGVKSLRELLDKCSKLKPKMKNDKMYVRCTCCGPAGIHGAATPEPKAAAQKAEGASSVREAKRAATAKRARDGDEEAAVVVKKKVDTRKVKKSK